MSSRRSPLRAEYVANLAWAAALASTVGKDILIEPINPRDMPGYFLNRQDEAHTIVTEIGMPNLKVQMDLYHCQMVEGDVAMGCGSISAVCSERPLATFRSLACQGATSPTPAN